MFVDEGKLLLFMCRGELGWIECILADRLQIKFFHLFKGLKCFKTEPRLAFLPLFVRWFKIILATQSILSYKGRSMACSLRTYFPYNFSKRSCLLCKPHVQGPTTSRWPCIAQAKESSRFVAELNCSKNETKHQRTVEPLSAYFFFFLKDIYSSLMVCQVEVKFWEGLKLFIDQKVVIELKPIFKA